MRWLTDTTTVKATLLSCVVSFWFQSPARADGPEIVQRIQAQAGHVVWQITRPKVAQARTDYPQIVLAPGNRVTITATGCVQTGGVGRTWKRYIAPAGPKSDTLYHGQLFIPGVMTGLETFPPTEPVTYDIPANASLPAGQNHLALGFTDDGYSDNGYWGRGHDDGTSNQCAGIGDASVLVDIETAPPPPPATPATQSYVVTIENVTIRRVRSRISDTDVLGAGVVVNGTSSAIATQKVGNWKNGVHATNFGVRVDEVEPASRIAVAYTILNAGKPNDQQIDSIVTNVVGSVAGLIPVAGSIIKAAADGWQKLFPLIDPDCDGPVFAGSIMGTGADFARWTQNGPLRRTTLQPGVDSATGCGSNSYYEVTYSIGRITTLQPFFVQVNAKTLATAVGSQAKLVKAP